MAAFTEAQIDAMECARLRAELEALGENKTEIDKKKGYRFESNIEEEVRYHSDGSSFERTSPKYPDNSDHFRRKQQEIGRTSAGISQLRNVKGNGRMVHQDASIQKLGMSQGVHTGRYGSHEDQVYGL